MRVFSRFALVVLSFVVLSAPSLFAQNNFDLPECPLSLAATHAGATDFNLSPHGVFRYNNQVFVLRGQTLTTYVTNDVGDLTVGREDFIGSMGARETNGGVTFSNGYLYVSSEAGLEIFDLRGVRVGGNAPILVSRTPGLHYRRLAVNGNTLAALYPSTDLPCYPTGTPYCANSIDLFNISNLNFPGRVGSISSVGLLVLAFNDIAFNYGRLYATGVGGTYAFDVSNPILPATVFVDNATPGKFLVSNNTNLLGVGNDGAIEVFVVPSTSAVYAPFAIYTLPALEVDRTNPIIFHPQAWFDDPNGRLVTMVDEMDPQTLKPARTLAFDSFDFTVPMWEGSDQRGYESVSYVSDDEVKWNPVVVGPYVYVVGDQSGLETWGACDQVTGHIDFDSTSALTCGGTEIHGWVTGTQKIENVELFLDGGSLGAATLGGSPRTDVSSRTPVSNFRINVNLDATSRGVHILRAVGTDSFGNRRQFASNQIFFNGPGQNCTTRRRVTTR